VKFLVLTRPIEGIEKKLPRPKEFEAQIEWIRRQLDSRRIDCAYHGENPRSRDRQCRVTRRFGAALRHYAAGGRRQPPS
jgi:hypothetical protein